MQKLTLYQKYDNLSDLVSVRITYRTPTYMDNDSNNMLIDVSGAHRRQKKMVHVGTRTGMETLESRGKAMGSVVLPIARSPTISLKSCAWTVSINRAALLTIPWITTSFRPYPRASSLRYIKSMWCDEWDIGGSHTYNRNGTHFEGC